jgi:hypothetical protein
MGNVEQARHTRQAKAKQMKNVMEVWMEGGRVKEN